MIRLVFLVLLLAGTAVRAVESIETDIVLEPRSPTSTTPEKPARWQIAAGLGSLAMTDASTEAFATNRTLTRWGLSLSHAPDGFAARLALDLQYAAAIAGANSFNGALSVTGEFHAFQLGTRIGIVEGRGFSLFVRPALSTSITHLIVVADSQTLTETALGFGLAGSLGAEWTGAGDCLVGGLGLFAEVGYDWQFFEASLSELGPDVDSDASPAPIPLVATDGGGVDPSGAFFRLGVLFRF